MNTNRYHKIIEVNGGQQLSLPIVKFPPFKLRAAMVEKDPVIWLHLLETYIAYFEYLMSQGRVEQIDDQTHEHFCLFIRSYLRELSDEEGKLLSLGMNQDVLSKLKLLRRWVFITIKKCGLMYFQISNNILWDLVRIYVEEYPDSVRSLIDGSLGPTVNTQKAQINRIYQVHQHIKTLVESSKFSRVDLKSLEALLAKKSKRSNKFTDQFLSTTWVETLEIWFKTQSGFLYEWSKKLAILSYLSTSDSRIVQIVTELNLSNLSTIQLYPLFGSLITNAAFNKYKPSLKRTLCSMGLDIFYPTLNTNVDYISSTSDIEMVREVFPNLSIAEIRGLLEKHNGDVERTINVVFENSEVVDHVQPSQKPKSISGVSHLGNAFKHELTESDIITKEDLSEPHHVPDELRNKTLTRALELLYVKNEDERDDTYDNPEVFRAASSSLDGNDNEEYNREVALYDRLESEFWELFKTDKKLFEQSSRGTAIRKKMKAAYSWSDEQIEGWARMIERSPRRAQFLEEKYLFKGNIRTGKRSFVQNIHDSNEAKERKGDQKDKVDSKVSSSKNSNQKKRQNARNERNKSSKANHNRKSGHDRKLAKATL
ncbi:LAFE_0C06348g1_1 [Lachancea fermentati]|uniref:LAFE_0C06348g1_1 n=1 Tax=Lachancea fermentati TaxID=4955 RepID=A0A1G4M9K7_LACFM|nr:LAFE_0C06348g1_1 [Lachancea fermentati]